MRCCARESSSSKRGRKACSLFNDSESDTGSPMPKKPKHCCPSPDMKNYMYSGASSEDDKQGVKYVTDFKVIRNFVDDLQQRERQFYQEQQKIHDDLQSFAREFHRSQQKRYDWLSQTLGDMQRRWSDEKGDRQPRNLGRLKQEMKRSGKEEEGDYGGVPLESKDRVKGNVTSRNGSIDVDGDHIAEVSTPPTARTSLSPLSVPDILKSIYQNEPETGSNQVEVGENRAPRFTAHQKGKQPARASVPFQNIGKEGHRANQSKPVPCRPDNRRAPKSLTPTRCDDSSDGDDEGEDIREGFQATRLPQDRESRSSEVLNEDRAIKGIETEAKASDITMEGEQRQGLSTTSLSDQGQVQLCQADQDGRTSTPKWAGIASSQLDRSLRKRQPVDYTPHWPAEIDEENATPPPPVEIIAKTPSKTPAKTLVKTAAKTPAKPKSRKKKDESDDESYLPGSVKENKAKDPKKGIGKITTGMRNGSMDMFVTRGNHTPTAKPMKKIDNHKPLFLSSDEDEPGPALSNRNSGSPPRGLQNFKERGDPSTVTFSRASTPPICKPTVGCSTPTKKNIREHAQLPGAASKYKAVWTTTPLNSIT